MNGSLVDWKDATIHVGSHVVHYGSGVFEGARCYSTPRGSACFRLDAHLRRLFDSAKIYRMEPRLSYDEVHDAVLETIRANEVQGLLHSAARLSRLSHARGQPVSLSGGRRHPHLGMGRLSRSGSDHRGCRRQNQLMVACRRNTFPTLAKSSANYANSQLIKMEAVVEGYSEGIALDTAGYLSEGSGQNLFLVRDNVIYTPPLAASVLPGITRVSVISLAQDLGFRVSEEMMPREMLYIADEAFFVGTAVEITPIRSVDKISIGNGRRGPITEAIQQAFFDTVNAAVPDRHGWLEYVYPGEPRTQAVADRDPRAAAKKRPNRGPMHINDLLKIAVDSGASDLHLKVGSYPMMRVRRHARRRPPRKSGWITRTSSAMATAVMSTSAPREVQGQLRKSTSRTACPGLGRFRCNVFQQRGTVGLVLRVIPMQIRTIDELGLPPVLKKIAEEERGLVLVTGTTGSGKSTTLAAMIDYINATRSAHIMTVEDPIEFLHRDKQSIVNQREVAVDTRSFAQALRSALRQDPDVILVGEMRDYETIETALLAAETGHLVFSTLHTLDATETINRIIAVFPPHQQQQVRLQLASVLKAVDLAAPDAARRRPGPRAGGRGDDQPRAFIRDCIVDKDKTPHDPRRDRGRARRSTGCRPSTSRSSASTSRVWSRYEEALRWASNVDEFKLKVQGISTSAETLRAANGPRQSRHHQVRRIAAGPPTSDGLHLLARRELSVAQVRARAARPRARARRRRGRGRAPARKRRD